jgi:uncharacterized membrane protein
VNTVSAVEALHRSTAAPATIVGFVPRGMRKGTPVHRGLGRTYLALMFFTVPVSLFITAAIPARLGHLAVIHLLSLLTLITAPAAGWAARRAQIAAQQRMMTGLSVGAVLVAGRCVLVPGRLLDEPVWG